jgi:DNA-binding beta-propeller fold protein YncE
MPGGVASAGSFVNFESGHVRPLALAAGGERLFAINTPDNRLEIYDVGEHGLVLAGEVVVGLEPVAVAVRSDSEVWVVNHLSDSVSIVAVDPARPERSLVRRTLLVGDEPRDIVFAGPGFGRAFITTAHRGQNRPADPELLTEGVGRADVWVFDANDLGEPLGGTPLAILELFGDTPRALAVSGDGRTVYAAVFQSGNRTASIGLATALTGGVGRLPPPPPGAPPGAPVVGLIVKKDLASGAWLDSRGADFSDLIDIDLPDHDVFVIDAASDPPALESSVSGVGTTLFNMAVRPGNGHLFVSNLEALNHRRFLPALRGHAVENAVTVVAAGAAMAVHLNPHIDYTTLPGPTAEVDATLALPTGLAFTADGQTVCVAAMGSDAVGIFDAEALESGRVERRIARVDRGPSGLVVDDARGRLYVMNQVGHSLSIVDLTTATETQRIPLPYDPAPIEARAGRPLLYDARATSGHGDMACASCHPFGDSDGLGWDLGDPGDVVLPNPNPRSDSRVPSTFHPLKGPMVTRTLRSLEGTGPLHWRGDRTGAFAPGGDFMDTRAALHQFNAANFVELQGRPAPLSSEEMERFIDFMLTLRQPPNPVRALDGSESPMEELGADLYRDQCAFCHALPAGTNGRQTFDFLPQAFKVPEARSTYQKVGRFGLDLAEIGSVGPQVRGFGFLHDGSASLRSFSGPPLFDIPDPVDREAIDRFQLSLDSGLRPVVGQQVTVTGSNALDPAVAARWTLLVDQADQGSCDLVAHGVVDGIRRGWLYDGAGRYRGDRATEPSLDRAMLVEQAVEPGQELTLTCVAPGSGKRISLDRDEDGALDRDELDRGTSPVDAGSFPVQILRVSRFQIDDDDTFLVSLRHPRLHFLAKASSGPGGRSVPPPFGSTGDPTGPGAQPGGATLTIYNGAGSGDRVVIPLPAQGWRRIERAGDPGYAYRDSRRLWGPIRSLSIRSGRISIRGAGPGIYELRGSPQGSMALWLDFGGGDPWCAVASALPPAARNDARTRFRGESQVDDPHSCPRPE